MRDDRLTALDGIAVLVTGLLTAALLAFPFLVAPSFAAMFHDLGGGPLPALTQLLLSRWFPLTLGAVTAVGPVLACIPAVPLAHRRWALVASFAFGCAVLAACWVGLYEPIFELAGKIKE